MHAIENKGKPFVKWVGGKTQLIGQLEALLPADFKEWENVTYIEPFVGGGAMLFHMLQHYPNITTAVINDINSDLTTCYRVVRDMPDALVDSLQAIQAEYYALAGEDAKRAYYLQRRVEFNTKPIDSLRNTTLFFFLNRTCFNGLYRVNKSGLFNVPFGRYETPTICDPNTIYADSHLLQNVTILTGDYADVLSYIDKSNNAFFYFDPPYRPISNTSNFTNYDKSSFNDSEQARLRDFCDTIHESGYKFMLSNSDCRDGFFDNLYSEYKIETLSARRSINPDSKKRGRVSELLIHNYPIERKE